VTVKLADLLVPERVVLPLEAATLADAGLQLADVVIASGAALDPTRLRSLMSDVRPRDVVAVGSQGFLLQLRSDAIRHLVLALGIAPRPVPRRAGGLKGARVIALVVAPPREGSAYLQVLSAVGRALGRREVVHALLAATTVADVVSASPLAEVAVSGELTVKDFMTRDVQPLKPDATIEEAAAVLVRRGVTAVPVVSANDEVLGMLGHRDLLRVLLPQYVRRVATGEFLARARAPRDASPGVPRVRDVMDRSVMCLSEDQSLAEVASVIVSRDRDRFPVVRDGVLVGMISRDDIVTRICGR
jgi:CBS domain-containing protein